MTRASGDEVPVGRPRRRPPDEGQGWERRPVLRETFLIQLGPELDDAARTMAEVLWTWVLDRWPLRRYRDPWVQVQLEAVVADLRFLAEYLVDHMASQAELSEVSDREKALLREVPAWARRVAAAAGAIEKALATREDLAAEPEG